MKRLFGFYSLKLPIYLVYMLQQVEYSPGKFIAWVLKYPRLPKVMYRQKLVYTPKAKLLVAFGYLFWLALLAVVAFAASINMFFIATVIFLPDALILAYLIIISLAWFFIELPNRRRAVSRASSKFAESKALRIAILGSYGKTTMKELLSTVLSEGKSVAATPGNKNIDVSHARWTRTLTGKEDILLIEYGEGQPGDIARLAKLSKPDIAVVTGLAPNHLDRYKTIDAVRDDLLSIADYVDGGKIYCNKNVILPKSSAGFILFDEKGLSGLQAESIKLGINGMSFIVKIKGKNVNFTTELVGRHLIGPLLVCIKIALDSGLSIEQIKSGVAKTKPFPHRLEPIAVGGAWIIDDTYNGSLEGFKAGLALLKELKAKRKIYVTPGLVDQGVETENVHREIGRLVAEAEPNKVVLMKNSVTGFIASSLKENGFKGELEVRSDPLEFYSNIEHILASGDLVLMQNDWTDNYL